MLSNQAAQTLKNTITQHNLTGESWDIAADLNQPRETGEWEPLTLPHKVVKSWLLEIGKLQSLLAGTDPLSQQFAFILTDPDYSEIPIFDNLTQYLFAQAVAAGKFTAPERAALEAKAKRPILRSWAQSALDMDVTQFDVEQAQEIN